MFLSYRTGAGTTAVVSLDGKTRISGNDKRLRIWDPAAGKELRRIEGAAAKFVWSADGRTLATRGKGEVRILDFASGQQRRLIATPDDELDTRFDKLAIAADGKTLALAGLGYLFAWDTATGRERLRRVGNIAINAIAFRPGEDVLTWGAGYDPCIHRWDLTLGKELQPCPGHESWVQSIAFAPDGKSLASSATDRTVRLWTLHSKEAAQKLTLSTSSAKLGLSNVLTGKVAYSKNGKFLAMSGPGTDVSLIDPATGNEIRRLAGSTGCYCLAFSPDSTLLAGGDNYHGKSNNPQGRVYIWDTGTGALVRTLDNHGDTLRSVTFSPDGKKLASGSDGVRLWEVGSGKLTRRFQHGRFVDGLAFTPDGKILAAGGKAFGSGMSRQGTKSRRCPIPITHSDWRFRRMDNFSPPDIAIRPSVFGTSQLGSK